MYTDFRPTPLQHYLFPAGADSLYMVVDERSRFREVGNFMHSNMRLLCVARFPIVVFRCVACSEVCPPNETAKTCMRLDVVHRTISRRPSQR